ncbi:MAG: carboxypeptidase regulatory-like domain-containing protein [Ignavibacteria bacterium]|jgi:hypothetical protein|nr:carboxypeptidase regulatory-like domain-containing protein [Ignavibacteria bacterium]
MKRISFLLATILICIFVAACGEEQQATNPSLTSAIAGKFLTDNGQPLQNVTVEATDANGNLFSSDITDAAGNFTISNLPEDTRNSLLTFVSNGNVVKQLRLETFLTLTKNAKTPDIFLGGAYDNMINFKVVVVDKSTQEAIEGAEVMLYTSNKARFTGITDAEGATTIDSLVGGQYNIRITKYGYNTYELGFLLYVASGLDSLYTFEATFELTSGKNSADPPDSTIKSDTLCCNSLVRIKVVDANGNLLQNAQTTTWINGVMRMVRTGVDGIAVWNDMCYGEHAFNISYVSNNTTEKYIPQTIRVWTTCEDTLEHIVVLRTDSGGLQPCNNNKVIVTVKDTINNRAVYNASVKLLDLVTNAVLEERYTDYYGQASFYPVSEGDYKVEVFCHNTATIIYAMKQITITVGCGQVIRVDANFAGKTPVPCSGTITVSAVDTTLFSQTNNIYVAGAVVTLIGESNANTNTNEITIVTGADGKAVFPNLPEGYYTIMVLHNDYPNVLKKRTLVNLQCNDSMTVVIPMNL